MELIKPVEIELEDLDGNMHAYTISRVPATVGRELIAKYPTSNMPKIGEYKTSEETMLLMMKFVEVNAGDRQIRLSTKALVDNHVPDATTLLKLEYKMLNYNTNFFTNGDRQGFLDYLISKAMSSISPMLIRLSEQLSQVVTQASQSSETASTSRKRATCGKS